MAERHPRPPGEGSDVTPDHHAINGTSRWQQVVGILGLVVVVWAGGDLFEVVTSDGAGGPGEAPLGGVTEGDQAPPAPDPHDPSRFDHGEP